MTIPGMPTRYVVMAWTLTMASWLPAAPAHAQLVSSSTSANGSSLGSVPPVTPGGCGYRAITFDATGVDVVRTVRVDFTASLQYMAGHAATLTSPSGRTFPIFTAVPYFGYYTLNDRYLFSDAGGGSWLANPPSVQTSPLPGGHYRTLNGATITSLDAAFAGDRGTGRWTLLFENCYTIGPGQVTAASLYLGGTPGIAEPATATTLGPIPDGPSTAPQTPGPSRDVTFDVPAGRGAVTGVRVRMTLSHAWMGDLVVTLIAPGGRSHVLFGYTGATFTTSKGSRANLNGAYEFHDRASQQWWSSVSAAGAGVVPSGAYRTSLPGGAGASGTPTTMESVFAGLPSSGTWTLRITDGAAGDVGNVSAALLSLDTSPEPVGSDDAYATPYLQTLAVAAPGVLSNDSSRGGGTMVPQLLSGPSHGTLSLQANGGFTYVPFAGFAGSDSFRYRVETIVGISAPVTVTIAVPTPTTLQAPVGLTAENISGQQVTLRWQPPPGTAPADYVMEGGVAPGQTQGAIAVGGPQPILTFPAPTGVFFLRVYAVANGQRSGPSNEIRVSVGVPEPPSPPAGLSGLVAGDRVGLSWRNTFAGGEPRDLQLLVTGAATAVLPLPLSESFEVPGVPPGTYAFRVRARNASGSSAESNTVALTFPASCVGAPAPPQNLLAYASGGVIHVHWDPGPNGSVSTSWLLRVGGSFDGTFPMPTRALHAPAPPGTYTIAVATQNACGASTFSPTQTVFVP